MPLDTIATLPNMVSMSRLVMAAIFPFVPGSTGRLVLIAAAGATDFLDGYLARSRGSTTRIGALIDPFADRCFILVAVFVLWADDTLSPAQMLVLAIRDVCVLAAFGFARGSARLRDFGWVARPAGKLVTLAQFVALSVAYLAPQWIGALVIVVGIASVVAIADYTAVLMRGLGGPLAILILLSAVPAAAGAQAFRIVPGLQLEARADVAASDRNSASIGAGWNVPAGYYVRVASSVSYGRSFGGNPADIVRTDVTARFLTDPFGEGRWGPYGGGGVAFQWTGTDAMRSAIVLLAGTELPGRGSWRPAVEASVGGGARLSLVIRRARSNGR